MADRVKSNSMEQVFHAVQTSPNINFKNYAPKDEYNLMGARELSDAVKAIIESNYNTGAYDVDYDYEQKETARKNINAANGGTVVKVASDDVPIVLTNIDGAITKCTGKIEPYRTGSGDASGDNVRDFARRNSVNLLGWYGKNICGGRALLDFLKRCLPTGVADYVNNTFTYSYGASSDPSAYFGPLAAYKANTRYTAIFTMKRSDTSGRTSSVRFNYTPSGFTNFEQFTVPYNSKQTVVTTSDSNKTVNYVGRVLGSGSQTTLTIYCNESGIFEGVKTESDYVPFDGFCSVINCDVDGDCYGGEFDLVAGIFKPYKYYAEYDGEQLVGEWLCNKAEYAEGTTPPSGSAVIDLGAYGEELEFAPPFPSEIHRPVSITVDRVTDFEIEYEINTNILIQNLLERVEDLEDEYDALDARVTALENPPAQTTELNPGNSTLDIGRPEINTLDPAISTPDVEPTEPTDTI